MTKFLTNDINLVARFVQLYTQLDLSLKQIKRMIDDATRYIDHLRLELSFLALGHVSPNLISFFLLLLFYVHGKHLRSCRDGQLT